MATADDHVLHAFETAPLAPEHERLTPEQLADWDAHLAFSRAHPEYSFQQSEVEAGLLRRFAEEGVTPPADLRQRVETYCTERGISLNDLCAQVEAKSAAAEVAWEAWCTERGIDPYPNAWPMAERDDLDPGPHPPGEDLSAEEWAAAWEEEIGRRVQEVETGAVQGIPWEDVEAKLRKKYGWT